MANRDSLSYSKFVRVCKRHLQWIGLSESARDLLAFLLVERYWSGGPLSPEELSTLSGYSRGSVSVAISQLRSLGFVESRVDMNQPGRGRRPTLYAITDGLSGLVMFGLRRLTVEVEGILSDLESMKIELDASDSKARKAIESLEAEAEHNLNQLRKDSRKHRVGRTQSKISAIETRKQ
ncbi:MAG: hypothetical protein ACXADL_03985 [Candidatus Thorarchaeota archaeon]|jgi:DNA-binding transcriptional regulator GbsR (MarR family)